MRRNSAILRLTRPLQSRRAARPAPSTTRPTCASWAWIWPIWDFVVALAGNPNVGKSTVFNALTGLRQHTGNWPGKTVSRAEGGFEYGEQRFKLIDLPGTYSLLATSLDEEVARDFILFGRPDVTIVVVDASRLERNLNLVLQVLEITDRVVVCLNLMDEARRHDLQIDERQLARRLGVPVIPTAARYGEGMDALLQAVRDVGTGSFVTKPHRPHREIVSVRGAATELEERLHAFDPALPNARWVALRLLDGDERIAEALLHGELGDLAQATASPQEGNLEQRRQQDTTPTWVVAADPKAQAIVDRAAQLRLQVGDFHEFLMEATFAEAADIADNVVTRPDKAASRSFEQTIDKLVTSRIWGFPLMIAALCARLLDYDCGGQLPVGLPFRHPHWAGLSLPPQRGGRASACRGGSAAS